MPFAWVRVDEARKAALIDWAITFREDTLGAEYVVVDRKGALVDRVQISRFRAIAGFGPSVIYLAVLDANTTPRLERVALH
jgi:hypothetical protein